jgi:glycosyltransferase involved in cell wall biosynthesis
MLSTFQNTDGIQWFVQEIWPIIARGRPDARLRILGKQPPPAVLALQKPGVEVVGFVEDLRPSLAEAAAVVVPLRLGSGTRLKIVEAMAMGKAVISTHLGAEGLEVEHGKDILLADEPEGFAREVLRVLHEPVLAARLGAAARALAVDRYAWSTAAMTLESLLLELVEGGRDRPAASRSLSAPEAPRRPAARAR